MRSYNTYVLVLIFCVQLKVKPLSLKFSPRYEGAGDLFWRASHELVESEMFAETCRVLQRCAECYHRANHLIRAAKVYDYCLTILLRKCQEDVRVSQLMRVLDAAHALYLRINQVDDAVRILDVSASHFLENNSCRESLDKGLGLLRRA